MKKSSYFVSRNTQFYGTFAQIPWYVRSALTGGVLGCLALVWYMTSYKMLNTMYITSCAALERASQDQAKFVDAQQNMLILSREVTQFQEQQKNKSLVLQGATVDAQRIVALVKQHGVALQLYAPQDPEATQHGFVKQGVRIDALGPYESLIAWVDAVAALSPALLFSYVHYEKHHDELLVSLHIFWYEASESKENSGEKEL